MSGNKQAYQAAYQRALAGKSGRTLLDLLSSPFEDNYTRQSREKGFKDGLAARESQSASTPADAGVSHH